MRLKWKTNPNQCEIWYSNPKDTDIKKHQLKIGDQFNIKIGNRSFCIGSESGKGEWITCKDRQIRDGIDADHALEFLSQADEDRDSSTYVLLNGRNFKQCYRCSSIEYFACRMTCVGDICNPSSNLAEQLCAPSKTSVYLTYVGGEYKVGASLGIPRRWIEQGSDLATIVVRAPGLEARRLEQLISTEFNLKLQVRNSTKLKNIIPNNLEDAKQQLQDYISDVPSLAKSVMTNVNFELIDDPKIQDLTPIYGDLDISGPIQVIDAEPGIEFGGTIVAIKGSILVAKQGPYHYAMNLKSLLSSDFKFLTRDAKIETQSFLDQWF